MLLVLKSPPANAGDIRDCGSIPGSEKPPGGRGQQPLQCSCLKNPMERQSIGSQKVELWQHAYNFYDIEKHLWEKAARSTWKADRFPKDGNIWYNVSFMFISLVACTQFGCTLWSVHSVLATFFDWQMTDWFWVKYFKPNYFYLNIVWIWLAFLYFLQLPMDIPRKFILFLSFEL